MSQASDVYAEAERRIDVARETGADTLDLSDLRALTRVPPAIGTWLAIPFVWMIWRFLFWPQAPWAHRPLQRT